MFGRPRALGNALLALAVASACGSPSPVATVSPIPTPTSQSSPTPTPQATPTPIPPSPTPSGVLDDRFGFLLQNFLPNYPNLGPSGLKVRVESDLHPLFELHSGTPNGIKVSPDGRRIAYWSATQLRVLDLTPEARPRVLLTLGSKENASYTGRIVWSSDGTGLVVGAIGPPALPGSDAPPSYTALRVVDVAGGAPREVIRIPGNIVPVAWDRTAHVIAAYMQMCCGANNYYVIQENGTVRHANVGGAISLYVVEASPDGQQVLGRGDPNSAIRVWPRDDYERGVELRSEGGKRIIAATWRPGTSEIGVLFADHMEFWSANGARRSLALPTLAPLPASNPNASLVFRADGNAAFIGHQGNTGPSSAYVLAVDIASGRTTEVDWVGEPPQPGTSIRIGT